MTFGPQSEPEGLTNLFAVALHLECDGADDESLPLRRARR
jgi:hypothetical protein